MDLTVSLAGEEVLLLPERALYWPAGATLFAADLHLGKADVFHRAGIPAPGGVTEADLARLSAVLERTGAQRLVILGDLLHAQGSRSPQVLVALDAWRARHPALDTLLVAGNHDRHAGPPPAHLDIAALEGPHLVGPFACAHEPPENEAGDHSPGDHSPGDHQGRPYTLCGHLHPVAVLAEVGGSVRLPCFHAAARYMVLPAFGRFTGGLAVRPAPGDRLFVVAGGRVLPL